MDSVDNPTYEGDAEERGGPTSPEQGGARGDDEEAGGAGERDSVHAAEKMEMESPEEKMETESPEETEMGAAVGTTGVSASTRFMPMSIRMDSINPFHLMQHGLFLLLYLYTTYDSALSRSGYRLHSAVLRDLSAESFERVSLPEEYDAWWDNWSRTANAYSAVEVDLANASAMNATGQMLVTIGAPRVRQVRAKIAPPIPALQQLGYSVPERQASYVGVDDRQPLIVEGEAVLYTQAAEMREANPAAGSMATYGAGGFLLNSSRSLDASKGAPAWIDAQTRAIIHDISVLNVATGQVCVCRLVAEFQPEGGVVTSQTTSVLNPFGVDCAVWSQLLFYTIIASFCISDARELLEVVGENERLIPLKILTLALTKQVQQLQLTHAISMDIFDPRDDETGTTIPKPLGQTTRSRDLGVHLLKQKHAETLSGMTGASKGQQKGAMDDAWESRKNHRHLLRLVDLERRLQLATEWEICRDPHIYPDWSANAPGGDAIQQVYYDLLGEDFDPETSKRFKVHQVDWNSVARYYKVYEIYLMKVEYFTQEDIDSVASKYADSADYVRAVWQHTNLLDALDSDPDELRRACEAAKGRIKGQGGESPRAAEYDHDWRDKPSGKRILAFRTLGHHVEYIEMLESAAELTSWFDSIRLTPGWFGENKPHSSHAFYRKRIQEYNEAGTMLEDLKRSIPPQLGKGFIEHDSNVESLKIRINSTDKKLLHLIRIAQSFELPFPGSPKWVLQHNSGNFGFLDHVSTIFRLNVGTRLRRRHATDNAESLEWQTHTQLLTRDPAINVDFHADGTFVQYAFSGTHAMRLLNWAQDVVFFVTNGCTNFLHDSWNMIDLVTYCMLMRAGYFRWQVFHQAADLASRLSELSGPEMSRVSIPLRDYVASMAEANGMIALSTLMLCVSLFKYIDLVPQMGLLTQVMSRSAGSLLIFLIVSTIPIVGYSLAFHQFLGTQFLDLSDLSSTITMVLRIPVDGSFMFYNDVIKTSSWVGQLLFMTYMILSFFVVINVFIAIIALSYQKVVNENPETHDVSGLLAHVVLGMTDAIKLDTIKSFARETTKSALTQIDSMLPVDLGMRDQPTSQFHPSQERTIARGYSDSPPPTHQEYWNMIDFLFRKEDGWEVLLSGRGWQPYERTVQAQLKAAEKSNQDIVEVTVRHHGKDNVYIINLREMTQAHFTEPMLTRPIRKIGTYDATKQTHQLVGVGLDGVVQSLEQSKQTPGVSSQEHQRELQMEAAARATGGGDVSPTSGGIGWVQKQKRKRVHHKLSTNERLDALEDQVDRSMDRIMVALRHLTEDVKKVKKRDEGR